MSAVLTAEQALKLVGEMFVYHMPFNRALGMELERYEKEFAQLAFKNQPMMVGNWAIKWMDWSIRFSRELFSGSSS